MNQEVALQNQNRLFPLLIYLQIIFLIHWLNVWSLKYRKVAKNGHYKFPQHKLMYLKCLLYPNNMKRLILIDLSSQP